MTHKFFRPSIIWLGVWLAIFIAIVSIGSWQNQLYWKENLIKFNTLEYNTVRTLVPYAVAYLEQQKRPDLLQQIMNADLGPYTLLITDRAGKIKYAPYSMQSARIDAGILNGQKFFYLYQNPASRTSLSEPHTDRNGAMPSEAANGGAEALGRLYLLPKKPSTLKKALHQAYWKILAPTESVLGFTLISYILVLVGFAAICAISARFQSHFQKIQERQYESELEAREWRIRGLEANIKSADLRLELLDQNHQKALDILNLAQNTISGQETAIQYESSRNEELEGTLRKAESSKNEALKSIQAIEEDREKIAAELKELVALREVEEMNYPEVSKAKTRRPKEFLWLNLVYKNLHFSRRALQNIIDLQDSHDIFPSLPDALASLNNSSVESLLGRGAVPSRKAVRYTQPLQHHSGEFWEYRFSKDGRIFFGLSQLKTWNIDTILLKRMFSLNRHKYEKYLEQTLGKDNDDLK